MYSVCSRGNHGKRLEEKKVGEMYYFAILHCNIIHHVIQQEEETYYLKKKRSVHL